MPGPDVTIILPCYNSGRTLRSCLESLYSNIHAAGQYKCEVIAPVRRSSDTTLELLRQYQPGRILEHDLAGISNAYNLGIAEASGRYVIFLNSDDELGPGFIRTMVQLAAADQKRNRVVYSSVQFIDINSRELYWRHPAPYIGLVQKYYSIILHPNAIYPTALVKKHPFEVLSGNPPRDREQVYALMQEADWSRTRKVWYRYRIWSSSGTVMGAKKRTRRGALESVVGLFGRIYVQSFETRLIQRMLRRRLGQNSFWRNAR